jgi:succinoglycan biosynthesis transport protein ExoP
MNEQPVISADDRHVRTGKFFARVYRYRKLLVRHWWILVIFIGVALGLETVHLRFAPVLFDSVGQMIVSVKLNISQSSLYSEDLGNFLGTQQALMQGSEVLSHARDRVAVQNPNLTPRQPSLNVSVLPKTTIFILRATGENADYTKAYLQACMEEYISLKKKMVARTSDTTSAGLTEQMLRLEPEIQKSDAEIAAFLSTNQVASAAEITGLGGYLTSVYQQLASAQSESDLLQSLSLDDTLLLEQSQSPMVPGIGGMGGFGGNGLLVNAGIASQSGASFNNVGADYLSVKQDIQLLQADTNRYGEILKPLHPKMVALTSEIERDTRELTIYAHQSLEQLGARTNALKLEIRNLKLQVQDRGRENLDISRKADEYQRLQAKAQRVQNLYDSLLATLQTLDVNKEISPESVTIYENASDATPATAAPTKDLLMAGFLGLALGLGVLLLLDRLDDRMNSFTELQEVFDEDVLGQIPRMRKLDRKGIIPPLQPDDQRHPFVEAYRNLRSSLLYMSQTGPRPRTLLITSSVPGDGKSLTATNLAITMAMGGSRVLLVDADLRKGNLQKRLNIEAQSGFSDLFLKGTDWHQSVRETAVANLFLMPRGLTTQRSSEFFIGPIMEKFLQESAQEYDYVLIDTAPVMAADDVTSLAPRVDGVIFVVRAEYTSSRVAHSALNMLYQRKANVLGVVFNSVHVSTGDYYYYYRYQDYHKASGSR